MDLNALLQLTVTHDASDLFLLVGAPPHVKVAGVMHPVHAPVIQPGEVRALIDRILDENQRASFARTLECNIGYTAEGIGRFRFNLYLQRGEVALVARRIPAEIPSFQALGLPQVLGRLAQLPRGLVLIVGAAGSGKSTTLASMIDHRAALLPGHILCVEDPIEFLLPHRKSLVSQREVGIDTLGFSQALRNAMREAPDVIMVGEIRDQVTMQQALAYAETGHLCLSTLHASNASQAIKRIVNFFPDTAHAQLFLDLSLNLEAIVSQRLLPGLVKKRVPAVELMLHSPYLADLIQKGRIDEVRSAMGKSTETGMQTFDQSLYDLFSIGAISLEQALANADSRTDLALRVRLHHGVDPADAGTGLHYSGEPGP
jgi:twitching motility protein PilU